MTVSSCFSLLVWLFLFVSLYDASDHRAESPSGPGGVHPDAGSSNLYVPVLPDIPSLPTVPSDSVRTDSGNTDDIDFDDLTKRFEALKKKK